MIREPLLLASAGMTVASLAVGVLAIAAQPPFGPATRFDPGAFVFAFIGAAGVVFGVGEIQTGAAYGAPIAFIPIGAGLLFFSR